MVQRPLQSTKGLLSKVSMYWGSFNVSFFVEKKTLGGVHFGVLDTGSSYQVNIEYAAIERKPYGILSLRHSDGVFTNSPFGEK